MMPNISQLLRAAIFHDVQIWTLTVIVAVVLVPPSLCRRIAKLHYVNLLGSTLIFGGVIIIIVYEILALSQRGARWNDVVVVNEHGFFVFVGLACSAFEGMACLVPIYDAAAHPEHFLLHYALVMTVISALLTSVGLLGYLAFGGAVETIVLVNFTPGTIVSVIQVAYAIGAFCTMPLFLLPAITLVEVNIFTPMTNPPLQRKCAKNVFRICTIALLATTSIYGAAALANFTSMLGALCGVPLTFVFPALCHLSLFEGMSLWEKVADVALIGCGLSLTVIITVVNAMNWGQV